MIYVFVILWGSFTLFLGWRAQRAMEARLLARIDQAISGVRVSGHAVAQRQVQRRRVDIARPRPIQVD